MIGMLSTEEYIDQQVIIEGKLYDVIWAFSEKAGKVVPTLEEAHAPWQHVIPDEALI